MSSLDLFFSLCKDRAWETQQSSGRSGGMPEWADHQLTELVAGTAGNQDYPVAEQIDLPDRRVDFGGVPEECLESKPVTGDVDRGDFFGDEFQFASTIDVCFRQAHAKPPRIGVAQGRGKGDGRPAPSLRRRR